MLERAVHRRITAMAFALATLVLARSGLAGIVMPDAGTSWFVDRKERSETAFVGDIIPDVEKTFRLSTAPKWPQSEPAGLLPEHPRRIGPSSDLVAIRPVAPPSAVPSSRLLEDRHGS